MIEYVYFRENYRNCFTAGEVFEFRPGINLLVGEQGCGKSSLIQLLLNHKKEKTILVVAQPIRSMSYDFEKDNLRTLSYFREGATDMQLAMMHISHGQSNNAILETLGRNESFLFIYDEPDMALSIRSCHKLVALLKTAAENKCQVIAAVHNQIVISAFPEVLSLEHKRWMSSAEFIDLHSSADATQPP